MKIKQGLIGFAGALLVHVSGQPAFGADDTVVADTIYSNGFVYKVDAYRGNAEAFAVKDGKFIAVGSDEDMKVFEGKDTRKVNLKGRMVMPGVVDTHIHPVRGGLTASGVSFTSAATLAEVKAAIKKHIADTKPNAGEWVEGAKWGTALQSTLTAKEIDEVSPNNPVYLHDWTNHILAVNSKALEAAKISKDTKDPADGKIDRDTDGNPNGILENAAASLITNIVPPPTEEKVRKAAETVFANLSQYGVTSISTAQLDATRLKAFRAMEKDGALTLRIKGHWDWNTRYADAPLPEMAKRFATREQRGPITELIDPDGVKIYTDGVPNGYSSPYIDPYADKPTFGTLSIDAPSLNGAVLEFDTMGLQVMMHAVGDMSVRHALDAVEATRKAHPSGRRHHIAHATNVHQDDLARAAQLNISVEISPWNTWAPDAGSGTWGALLGRERIENMSPFRGLTEAGNMVGYGSDWDNVAEPDPWFALEAMVTRMNPNEPERGKLGAMQAIDVQTAIEVLTYNGAYNLEREHDLGSIEVGKLADFIVINQNLLEVSASKLHKTKVLQTVVAGKTVYQR